MGTTTNLHLIRAFEGPRHARLEKIWERVEQLVRPHGVVVHIHDNLERLSKAQLSHGEKLQEIWEGEKADPAPQAIFTEFDFLPDLAAGLVERPGAVGSGSKPIHAAEYATRSPLGRRLVRHGIPGAWFVAVDKRRLGRDTERVDFRPGGPGNDPAGRLPPDLVQLLGAEEGTYSPFGCRVPGCGEHLFWSRHYNDPPTALHAGFVMGEIQRAVDRACDLYEAYLERVAA